MNSIQKILAALTLSLVLISPQFVHGADKDLGTALYEASVFQDLPKMKELIAKGANPNFREGGRTILGWAAQNGNVEVVQLLLDAKADVKAVDEGIGHTPLMRAVETQHIDIVKALLKAKSDPNAQTPQGERVLDMAVKSRKPEIVQAVVDAGADVKYVDKDGNSPVLIAAQDGMTESAAIIAILGKAKADLNVPNIVYSPLYYAAEQGNKEIVKALLDAGADPNAKTPMGKTALEGALDKKEVVELLLAAKVDPNQPIGSGSTVLISAIENGSPEVVEVLLKAGADVNRKDERGSSPLQVANNYSKTDVAEILKKHGATE